MKRRPLASEYDAYYHRYIEAVPVGDIVDILVQECSRTVDFFDSIPAEKESFRYEPGKWSVCEVVGHLVDTERIFSYRVLRAARGDETPMAGMDQDEFIAATDFNERGLSSLAREFQFLRSSNIELFDSFPEGILDRVGTASDLKFTTRALMYILAGHAIHHVQILKDRYL